MSNRRVVLLMLLTAILAGYGGFFCARYFDFVSKGSIELIGLAGEVDLNTGQATLPTPKFAMNKCRIAKYEIELASENTERVSVKLGDLSSKQLECLLDEGQQSIKGDPPPSPMQPSTPSEYKSFRPLYVSFLPVSTNAQKN